MTICSHRWSLQSLFVAATVCAIVLGVLCLRRKEQQTVELLRDMGIEVSYGTNRSIVCHEQGWMPVNSECAFSWIDRTLGADVFERAKAVKLGGSYLSNSGIANLARLRGLEEIVIYMDDNHASRDLASGLRDVPCVRRLLLFDVAITDDIAVELGKRQKLCQLALDGCTFQGRSPVFLSRLPLLTELALSNTDIADRDLVHLGVNRLTALELGRSEITTSGISALANLTSLRYLGLRLTQVDDDAIPVLCSLTSLEHLDVRGTLLTKHGVGKLRDAIPKCWVSEDASVEYIFGRRPTPEERHEWDYSVRHPLIE